MKEVTTIKLDITKTGCVAMAIFFILYIFKVLSESTFLAIFGGVLIVSIMIVIEKVKK